jgi:hypothetical protein
LALVVLVKQVQQEEAQGRTQFLQPSHLLGEVEVDQRQREGTVVLEVVAHTTD